VAIHNKNLDFFPNKKTVPVVIADTGKPGVGCTEKNSAVSPTVIVVWPYALALYLVLVAAYCISLTVSQHWQWQTSVSCLGLIAIVYLQNRHVVLLGFLALVQVMTKISPLYNLRLYFLDIATFLVVIVDSALCVSRQGAWTRTRTLLVLCSTLAVVACAGARLAWTDSMWSDVSLVLLLTAAYACTFHGIQGVGRSVLDFKMESSDKTSSIRWVV